MLYVGCLYLLNVRTRTSRIHMSNNCNYAFRNRKTGHVIITQTWAEFYEYQRKAWTGWNSEWIALDEHKRLGTTTFPTSRKEAWDACTRFNAFWSGAKGYEKVAGVRCIGWIHTPIRLFLWHVHNCACMEGDLDLVKKADQDDRWFYDNSNHSRLLLTY
jgi:hypothetical protein